MMRKRISVLVLVVLALFFTACTNNSSEGPVSVNRIKLTCKMTIGEPPCANIESQDLDVIAVVETAISNAEQMPGMLNYAVESILRLSTQEKTESYYLNLGSDRESSALLVKWPDTSTGYEISTEDANRLRDVFGR